MQFQRTAGSVLTVCLSPGDNPIKGLDWTRYERTLVLALKIGCHFCEESVPFYKKLVRMRELGETDVYIVATFPDEAESVDTYVAQHELKLDTVPGIPSARINAWGTPTLFLVDRQGRVIKSWVGHLSAGGEEEVMASMKALNWNPTRAKQAQSKN